MSTQTITSDEVEAPLRVDRQNMAYELADQIGYRCRIGLIVLASDLTIEYEFRKMLDIPGVALYESRIYNDSDITPETLAAMEGRIAGRRCNMQWHWGLSRDSAWLGSGI